MPAESIRDFERLSGSSGALDKTDGTVKALARRLEEVAAAAKDFGRQSVVAGLRADQLFQSAAVGARNMARDISALGVTVDETFQQAAARVDEVRGAYDRFTDSPDTIKGLAENSRALNVTLETTAGRTRDRAAAADGVHSQVREQHLRGNEQEQLPLTEKPQLQPVVQLQAANERELLRLPSRQIPANEPNVEKFRTSLDIAQKGVQQKDDRQRSVIQQIGRVHPQDFAKFNRIPTTAESRGRLTSEQSAFLASMGIGSDMISATDRNSSIARGAPRIPFALGPDQRLDSLQAEAERAQEQLNEAARAFQQVSAERVTTINSVLRGMEDLLRIDNLFKALDGKIQSAIHETQQRQALSTR